MESLALWLLVVGLTPKCYEARAAAYKTCMTMRVPAAVCQEPSQLQGVSLALGRPAIKVNGGDECLQVLAVKVSGKLKQYTLADWNKNAEAGAQTVK